MLKNFESRNEGGVRGRREEEEGGRRDEGDGRREVGGGRREEREGIVCEICDHVGCCGDFM